MSLSEGEDESIGLIHSFESCGTLDGPGLRYVVFMQGCPLRCLYCHNPDTFKQEAVNHRKSAIEVMGEILKFRAFYVNGGVTLSGGEPLMQPRFVRDLFKLCRENGFHTTVDTSGFYLNDAVKEVLEYTNLVLLDIKCIDPSIYKNLTGQELAPTLRFAEYLSDKNIPVWIRYVLVPGITDDDELIEKHADYLTGLKNIDRVEVLPYHEMALLKYENMGLEYPLEGTKAPTIERIENAKSIYLRKGFDVS